MADILSEQQCVIATIVSRHEFNGVVATKVFLNVSRAYLWGEEQIATWKAKAVAEDPDFEYGIEYVCETQIVAFDGAIG